MKYKWRPTLLIPKSVRQVFKKVDYLFILIYVGDPITKDYSSIQKFLDSARSKGFAHSRRRKICKPLRTSNLQNPASQAIQEVPFNDRSSMYNQNGEPSHNDQLAGGMEITSEMGLPDSNLILTPISVPSTQS